MKFVVGKPFDRKFEQIQVEYWTMETFDVRLIVYNVSRCLSSASKLKIQFHLGAYSSNTVDYPLCEYHKGSKNFFTITPTTYQLMCLSVLLPDNRLKFQIQFALDSILDEMVKFLQNHASLRTKREVCRNYSWIASSYGLCHIQTPKLSNFNLLRKLLTGWSKRWWIFVEICISRYSKD